MVWLAESFVLPNGSELVPVVELLTVEDDREWAGELRRRERGSGRRGFEVTLVALSPRSRRGGRELGELEEDGERTVEGRGDWQFPM